MVISGWVLTLVGDEALRATALHVLATEPGLELGEMTPQGRLPVASEAADARAARDLLERLRSLPGVLHADVVGVYFDGPQP